MAEEQFDVLILHCHGEEEELIANQLTDIIQKDLKIEDDVKVTSVSELLFGGGDVFQSVEDAIHR